MEALVMQAARPASAACDIPSFRAPYAPADETLAEILLRNAARPAAAEARIDARATRLVEAIRARSGRLGGIEDFLHAYALSTKEGLALMVLAEALLRATTPVRPRCWSRRLPGLWVSPRRSSIRARLRKGLSIRSSSASACRR